MPVLVDTGPLVAIIDKSDAAHNDCTSVLRKLNDSMLTVWPVITEVMYLLEDYPKGRETVWDLIQREISIVELTDNDIPRIRELMRKYEDLPMDLADATIVRVAELMKIETVFTTDKRDFNIYRPQIVGKFKLLPR